MSVDEVTIRLSKEELYMLILSAETYESELKNIYDDKEELKEKQRIMNALCNELNNIYKIFR